MRDIFYRRVTRFLRIDTSRNVLFVCVLKCDARRRTDKPNLRINRKDVSASDTRYALRTKALERTNASKLRGRVRYRMSNIRPDDSTQLISHLRDSSLRSSEFRFDSVSLVHEREANKSNG